MLKSPWFSHPMCIAHNWCSEMCKLTQGNIQTCPELWLINPRIRSFCNNNLTCFFFFSYHSSIIGSEIFLEGPQTSGCWHYIIHNTFRRLSVLQLSIQIVFSLLILYEKKPTTQHIFFFFKQDTFIEIWLYRISSTVSIDTFISPISGSDQSVPGVVDLSPNQT